MRCSCEVTGTTCSPVPPGALSVANSERPLHPSTVHSFPSLAGLLLLVVTLASTRTPCFPLPGPVCFVWDCCYYSAFSLDRPQSSRGFFMFAQRKAVGYSHTAPITSLLPACS